MAQRKHVGKVSPDWMECDSVSDSLKFKVKAEVNNRMQGGSYQIVMVKTEIARLLLRLC